MIPKSITAAQVHELTLKLDGSTRLLTPQDGTDFRNALFRWSVTATKEAVSCPQGG